jgi:hypothetical protein
MVKLAVPPVSMVCTPGERLNINQYPVASPGQRSVGAQSGGTPAKPGVAKIVDPIVFAWIGPAEKKPVVWRYWNGLATDVPSTIAVRLLALKLETIEVSSDSDNWNAFRAIRLIRIGCPARTENDRKTGGAAYPAGREK